MSLCADWDGSTPLHTAAAGRYGEVVSALLAKGADKDTHVTTTTRRHCCKYAVNNCHLGAVDVLLTAGADSNTPGQKKMGTPSSVLPLNADSARSYLRYSRTDPTGSHSTARATGRCTSQSTVIAASVWRTFCLKQARTSPAAAIMISLLVFTTPPEKGKNISCNSCA